MALHRGLAIAINLRQRLPRACHRPTARHVPTRPPLVLADAARSMSFVWVFCVGEGDGSEGAYAALLALRPTRSVYSSYAISKLALWISYGRRPTS